MAEFLHTALLNISVLLHIPFIKAEQKIYTFKKPSAHFGNVSLTKDKQKILQAEKLTSNMCLSQLRCLGQICGRQLGRIHFQYVVNLQQRTAAKSGGFTRQCSQTGKCSPSLYINCARKALYCKYSKHACNCKRILQILAWKISSLKGLIY